MAIAVTLTFEQLAAELDKQAQQGSLFMKSQAGQATNRKITIMLVAGVKENFAKGMSPDGVAWPAPVIRGGKALRDTGRLMAAVTGQVTPSGPTVSNNLVQARIMNEGGIIRAKGKFLAIPLTAQARRVSSPRAIPGLHFEGKKNARKGALVDRKGIAQFALVPSVRIPKREFMGFSSKVLERVEQVLQADLAKFLAGGE